MKLMSLFIFVISLSYTGGLRFKRNQNESNKKMTTNEEIFVANRYAYFEEKVTQLAGISCDLCMKAVYGVNYDFIQMKKNVTEMIRLDCEALFHGTASDISECVRFMTEKVDKYSNKIERLLNSRRICVLLRVCANEETTVTNKAKIEEQI